MKRAAGEQQPRRHTNKKVRRTPRKGRKELQCPGEENCISCGATGICENYYDKCKCGSVGGVHCYGCDGSGTLCLHCYTTHAETATNNWYEDHDENCKDCPHEDHPEDCLDHYPVDSDRSDPISKEKIKEINAIVDKYNEEVNELVSESILCESCRKV